VNTQFSEDELQRKLARAARMRDLMTTAKEVADTIVNMAIQAGIDPSHRAGVWTTYPRRLRNSET